MNIFSKGAEDSMYAALDRMKDARKKRWRIVEDGAGTFQVQHCNPPDEYGMTIGRTPPTIWYTSYKGKTEAECRKWLGEQKVVRVIEEFDV